jgi:hypothetical protein
MKLAAAIRAMVAAGCTAEQIVAVVKAIEAEKEKTIRATSYRGRMNRLAPGNVIPFPSLRR